MKRVVLCLLSIILFLFAAACNNGHKDRIAGEEGEMRKTQVRRENALKKSMFIR